MSTTALSKLGFTGSHCPVTRAVSPNMTASFPGFHISFNASVAGYGSATTAIVLQGQVFFILNGNHCAALSKEAREAGIAGCMRYFAQHIDQANKYSEHQRAVGLASDRFGLQATTQACIGESGIALVAQAAKAATSSAAAAAVMSPAA